MQIQTNQKQRELKDHGTFAFPVNVSHENLFSYERSSCFWHWHFWKTVDICPEWLMSWTALWEDWDFPAVPLFR